MELGMKLAVLALLFFVFSVNAQSSSEKCNFPAIFNFGDSNSDTGGSFDLNLFPGFGWPYGFSTGKFFKRASDGRLIIDFVAESIGLPYLNASVGNGTSFKYGANFAVAGQRANSDRVTYAHFWDYPLGEQVSQFLALKSSSITNKEPDSTSIYPKPTVFSEALYTIDIGQNDIGSLLFKNASATLDDYAKAVKRLLNDGAKYFWIHNTCPWGCLPKAYTGCGEGLMKTCTKDEYGCIIEYNNLSQQYNSELQKRVDQWRKDYPEAVFTLVDMYAAKHSLATNATGFGSASRSKWCCGDKDLGCDQKAIKKDANGAEYVCDDPSKYYSWDGMHYTEAANKYIANLIIDGSFSERRVPLTKACRKS